MAHAHAHADPSANYYMDQICTVAACGVLGVICVLMERQAWLGGILAPQFYVAVLWGGIALLALVVVRGVGLWQEAGQRRAVHEHHHHDHHHEHGEHCDHDHKHDECCDHDHHHHGDDYSWTPAKYAVLVIPMVLLYVVGYLNLRFSDERLIRGMETGTLEGGEVTAVAGETQNLRFRELSEAAFDPNARKNLEGRTGRIQGMFMRMGNDKEFTVFRIKMRCCAADAVPAAVRIISPKSLTQMENRTWVEATGQIQFRKLAGQDKYVPVIVLASGDDVKKMTNPPKSEFDMDS